VWAAYSLLLQRRPADLPADVALAASIAAALPMLLTLVWSSGCITGFTPTPRLGRALAYIVVMASAIGYPLWSYGVAVLGAERAGPYVNLMPLFGTLLAILLLGETLAPLQLLGAVLVFAGVACVGRAERRRAEASAARTSEAG